MSSTGLILAIAAVPAVLAGFLWMSKRRVRFLAAYLAVLPFGSAIALPIGLPRAFSTVSSLLGVLVGGLYVWRWISERPGLRIPSMSVPFWVLYFAWAVATSVWTIKARVTTNNLMVLGVLVGLFVVIVLTPITRDELREVRAWIAAGGGLTGLYALALAASGTLTLTGAGVARFEITGAGGGEGGDPNITAAALIMPIAVALWEGLNPDRPRRSRIVFLASAGLAGVAVLLTASRGGILSIVIVVLITLLSQRRGLGSMILIGLMVLPAALLVPATFQERVDNTGTTGRTAIWKLAIESCPEYCPIGSGFGTFADVHEVAFLETQGATGTKIRYQAHSIWFESLIEVGVLGFALLVAAIYVTVRDLWRLPVRDRQGAFAGLAALLFANTFLSNLTFKYFWLGLIYAVLVVSAVDSERTSEARTPHQVTN
ncbi:MAG: O-antigen ligase family protein [Acidimicrobiia bacterium]|nr:O-antigen ligase family protein [Acidimicrobiia bacterium]MDH5504530.1 O-antigen ligase family protein [Acidimicrobiia bacterium]